MEKAVVAPARRVFLFLMRGSITLAVGLTLSSSRERRHLTGVTGGWRGRAKVNFGIGVSAT